jgi:F-type H+-transporting ATPase subunit b
MGAMMNPDTGLVIWTIVTFVSLVFILKAVAWAPLIKAIEDRELRLKSERDGAEKARAEAERIQKDLEAKMNDFQAKSREMMAQATKEGEALRASLKASAESDSQKIKDKTMQELADEKERLVRDLRKEVAGLSVLAAEKLLHKSVDAGVEKSVLESFFKDLDAGKKAN